MARGDRSPRSEHANKMRTALLEAALNLFSANGYEQTTTDEIADAAGVSPRTFFRYFPTKEDVVLQDDFDVVVVNSELESACTALVSLLVGRD